eukprot:gnl/MRDRNA2_/MRDRNA2_77620_c0_seq1.p1 gnl/MRDRNA2_/MRDRNA2_77620_c0~~gnl/MRDRNA2_/MRDRNA2_77620_c0_seq1.p1  ORF type:complete len:768 (-),score=112.33 gnl/MRDRNA2_/MRDRNA2_77620_c0_seq1:56-2359(-)
MPPLKWCGQEWRLAADDFGLIGQCYARMHVFWLMLCLPVLLTYGQDLADCMSRAFVLILSKVVVSCLNFLLEIKISLVAQRGSIFDDSPREMLPQLLTVWSCLLLVELMGGITGAIVFFPADTVAPGCPDDPKWHEPGAVAAKIAVQTVVVSQLLHTSWAVFSSFSLRKTKVRQSKGMSWDQTYHDKLKKSMTCCCIQGRSKTAIEVLAEHLALFTHNTHMTASDVLAGLALVADQQRTAEEDQRGMTGGLACVDPLELKEFMDFMPYAWAVYGWKMQLFVQGWNSTFALGFVHLMALMPCCTRRLRRQGKGRHAHENCLRMNEASMCRVLSQYTESETGVLVLADWQQGVSSPCWAVFVDSRKKAVIISVRGTLSLEDVFTDLLGAPEALDLDSNGCGGTDGKTTLYAHGAMVKAAHYIVGRLEEEGDLINQLLEGHGGSLPDCQGYEIVCTGHSLGAGVAVLIAFLLRKRWSQCRAVLFSPPGGLLSPHLALDSENFAVSLVVGDECVPRLSYESMEDLRDQILIMAESCPYSKMKILKQASRALLTSSVATGASGPHNKRGSIASKRGSTASARVAPGPTNDSISSEEKVTPISSNIDSLQRTTQSAFSEPGEWPSVPIVNLKPWQQQSTAKIQRARTSVLGERICSGELDKNKLAPQTTAGSVPRSSAMLAHKATVTEMGTHRDIVPPHYPPGLLFKLHLVKSEKGLGFFRCCRRRRDTVFVPTKITKDDLREICVSSKMFEHHLVPAVEVALRSALESGYTI